MAKDTKSEPKPEDAVDIVLDDADTKVVERPEDDLIVVAPQEDAPVITGDPPPKPISGEEGIEVLKAKLAESERARLESDARAQQERDRANNAGREVQDTQLTLVVNAIENVKSEMDRQETDYAQALTDQDYAGAAKIQRAMSENASRLQTLEGGKLHVEAEAKKPPPTPQVDIVDQFADQVLKSGSPRSAQWIRSHPQYARDPRLNRQMIRAHEDAIDDGIQPDSDAYFDSIETKLGLRRAESRIEHMDDAVSAAAEQIGTRTAPPAAPVSRGTSNGASSNPNTVRLSSDEREIAKMNGMTDKEYAVQKLALIREGKLQ